MLHIIYLINDVGHHCSRKNLTDLQKSIGDVVGWIVGITDHSQSDENKEKLTKVLKIWETNKVFLEDVMEVSMLYLMIFETLFRMYSIGMNLRMTASVDSIMRRLYDKIRVS